MTLHFVPIPTTHEHLRAWSAHWLPFLEGISKRSKEPVEQLLDQVARGDVQVALVWDDESKKAHALVGMRYLRRGADLVGEICWLTGSGVKDWLGLLPELERYLKQHVGCAVIRPVCRPGWWRLIKGSGYRTTHFVLEKTL